MTDPIGAERQRRRRARQRGESVPFRPTGRPRRKPADYEEISSYDSDSPSGVLRRLGVDVGDQQRAADAVSARRSREQADRDASIRYVSGLASGVWRARRTSDLAFQDWRARPSRERLDEFEAANRMRNLLEEALREACLNDGALVTAVMKAAR